MSSLDVSCGELSFVEDGVDGGDGGGCSLPLGNLPWGLLPLLEEEEDSSLEDSRRRETLSWLLLLFLPLVGEGVLSLSLASWFIVEAST